MTRHDYASEERETYNDRFGDPETQVGIGERYMRFQPPGACDCRTCVAAERMHDVGPSTAAALRDEFCERNNERKMR